MTDVLKARKMVAYSEILLPLTYLRQQIAAEPWNENVLHNRLGKILGAVYEGDDLRTNIDPNDICDFMVDYLHPRNAARENHERHVLIANNPDIDAQIYDLATDIYAQRNTTVQPELFRIMCRMPIHIPAFLLNNLIHTNRKNSGPARSHYSLYLDEHVFVRVLLNNRNYDDHMNIQLSLAKQFYLGADSAHIMDMKAKFPDVIHSSMNGRQLQQIVDFPAYESEKITVTSHSVTTRRGADNETYDYIFNIEMSPDHVSLVDMIDDYISRK